MSAEDKNKTLTTAGNGLLSQLPPPPEGKNGWPWNEETDPSVYSGLKSLPKISIVTPSLNQGRFIEKTIRSVLLQNYPNLEFIVIDGGSTDETIEVLAKYSKWIDHFVSEKDSGQSDAINKGLKECTGDIFNWLNSDDYYHENCFCVLASNYVPGKTKLIAGDYRIFHDDGTEDDKLIDFKLQPTLEQTLAIVLLNQPSCFFDLESLKKLGELNVSLQYVMDQDIFKRFLFTYGQEDILYVSKLLTHFRIHSESKTYQFRFQNEYNRIFASIAKKCGLVKEAKLLEEIHGIKDYKGYEFEFEFDARTASIAIGAIQNVLYQAARKASTTENFKLLGKCLSLIDVKYLNKYQKSYANRLKLKRTLRKFNILPALKFILKSIG